MLISSLCWKIEFDLHLTMASSVLVYEGPGASPRASRLLMTSLQRCLSPRSYRVHTISPQQIKQGLWQRDCAALVLGGGYDMGYLQSLGQEGADLVREYVLQGGAYLGLCAGGYFACDYIQFEKGTHMEVCGQRPLKFFPGQCVGSLAPNFKYNSERGAAALPVQLEPTGALSTGQDQVFPAYVNGGGAFFPYLNRDEFPDARHVTTLATFPSLSGQPAAVVQCGVGSKGGAAVLAAPHLEFAARDLDAADPHLSRILPALQAGERQREQLWKVVLRAANLATRMEAAL